MMTIILQPQIEIPKLEGFTLKIAKWMQETIQELYGYHLEIKEPNDLYFNGKKIAGILTQINTVGQKINYMLVSIGFNVNQREFPREIELIATSLKKEVEKDFKREDIIIKLIEKLEKGIELSINF